MCDHCCQSVCHCMCELFILSVITHQRVYGCRPNMVRIGDPFEMVMSQFVLVHHCLSLTYISLTSHTKLFNQ